MALIEKRETSKGTSYRVRERIGTDVSNVYASYNAKDNVLSINDITAFTRMAERAFQSGSAAKDLSAYFDKLIASIVKVVFTETNKTNANSQVIAQLKAKLVQTNQLIQL